MYTQIADEVAISPGVHNVSIAYSAHTNSVEYRLDGKLVTRINDVGVPLDRQHVKFTGAYPSLGAAESLAGKIHSFSIGHGLFSLLDAFPFQHPDSPGLSVSIPVGAANPPPPAGHVSSARAPTAPGTTSSSRRSTRTEPNRLPVGSGPAGSRLL